MKYIVDELNITKVRYLGTDAFYDGKCCEDITKTICLMLGIRKIIISECNSEIIVGCRGVSSEHKLSDDDMSNIFIVGDKAKYFLNDKIEEIYNNNNKSKEVLSTYIDKQIDKVNKILFRRAKIGHKVSGVLPYVDKRLGLEKLHFEKLIVLAILHNLGNEWGDKKNSPFLSITHGIGSGNVAKRFSRLGYPDAYSYVHIYFIPRESDNYLKTSKLNEWLKQNNVEWYYDTNKEIIMLDGVFPHQLFGIVELNQNMINTLIVNPWLIKHISSGFTFNPPMGMYIDQRDFESCAKNLGYKKFIKKFLKKRFFGHIGKEADNKCGTFTGYENDVR